MPQNGKERPQPEHFFELTDHALRERLNHHLPEAIRGQYRIASLTWCLYGKKWLIKAVRKEDGQQTAAKAESL